MAQIEATGMPGVSAEFTLDMPIEEVEKQVEADIQSSLQKIEEHCEALFRQKATAAFSDVTAPKYSDGIKVTRDETVVEATIGGWLPTALEEGAERFDMKPGLLAGRPSRIIRLRNGNFRTVSRNSPPNSWIHPGLVGKHFMAEVQDELQAFGDDLFKQIRERVAV